MRGKGSRGTEGIILQQSSFKFFTKNMLTDLIVLFFHVDVFVSNILS